MFPINPYSFQSSPNSNISTSMSVCSLLHWECGLLSRSLFGAIQLLNHKHTSHGNKAEHLPCTPSLNNTCDHCLLRIISDVRSEVIYCLAEVIVRASHNLRCLHAQPQVSSILANEECKSWQWNLQSTASSQLVLSAGEIYS